MVDQPQSVSLWATYSIRDHLDPNRFIADALIYDHLVIPVPVKGEEEVWIKSKCDIGLQDRLIAAIKSADRNEQLLLEIPWNEKRQKQFKNRFGGGGQGHALNNANAVDAMAQDLQAMKDGKSKDAAFGATAGMLADLVEGNADDPIVEAFFARVAADAGVPEAVLAYHRLDNLKTEIGVGKAASLDERLGEIAYASLDWSIDVPEAEGTAFDAEKLKAAVTLAVDPDWRNERAAFNRWIKAVAARKVDPEIATGELQRHMENLKTLNKEIGTATKAHKIARFSGFTMTMLGGFADPASVVVIGLASKGLQMAVEYFLPVPEVPARLYTAAYVHEARKVIDSGER